MPAAAKCRPARTPSLAACQNCLDRCTALHMKKITGPLYRIQIRMPSPAILNMIIMRNFSFFSSFFKYQITDRMKKRSETQTLPLAVVRRSQKFSPRGRPAITFGAGRPKFNQLEMVTTFTYRTSFVKIDARNFELSW